MSIIRNILGRKRPTKSKLPLLYKHRTSQSSIYGEPPAEALATCHLLVIGRAAPDVPTAWRLMCQHPDLTYEQLLTLYRRKRVRQPRVGKIARRILEALW